MQKLGFISTVLALVLAVRCDAAIPLCQEPQSQGRDSNLLWFGLVTTAESAKVAELLRRYKDQLTPGLCIDLVNEAKKAAKATQHVRAAFLYQTAIDAAFHMSDTEVLPYALDMAARYHFERGDLKGAISLARESKRVSEEINSYEYLVSALRDLGTFQVHSGEYEQAKNDSLECLKHSLPFVYSSEPRVASIARQGAVTAWATLADVAVWEGDYQSSLVFLQKALNLSTEIGLHDKRYKAYGAHLLAGLGIVHWNAGDYEQAHRCFDSALAVAQAEHELVALQRVQNCLGILYSDEGNYVTAMSYLRASLATARDIGNDVYSANVLANIGFIQLRQNDLKGALTNFEEALIVVRGVEAPYAVIPIHEGLAASYHAQGRYDFAIQSFDKALDMAQLSGDRTRQSEILWWKGETRYAQGQYRATLRLSEEAYKLASQQGASNISRLALTLTGKVHVAQQEYDAAAQALGQAIETIEHIRANSGGQEQQRALFFENKLEPYHLMVELLIAQHKEREALLFAERARGRGLLDVLRSSKVDANSVMTAAEREQHRKANSEIVSLNTQIYTEKLKSQPDKTRLAKLGAALDATRLEYQTLMDGVYVAHPELRTSQGDATKFTAEEMSELLPDSQTALLEFVVMADKTYLFVVSRDRDTTDPSSNKLSVKAYPIKVKVEDLRTAVETFRERLSNPHFSAQSAGRKLYDLLLRPGMNSLAKKTTLIVAPDGILWDLPFQALTQEDSRYLIEDHALSYAPSLHVLHEMSKKRGQRARAEGTTLVSVSGTNTKEDILAFGNPRLSRDTLEQVTMVHRDERLLPLPEAEAEVKSLGRLYGDHSKVYVGAEAREENAKREMSGYSILHFATHGILDAVSPMYSSIVLSGGEGTSEDGLLEAWEISKLNLKADIAVLSACDTARGRIGAGEGMIGMSWAFFVAGCPTTVVSQWRVDSASTTALMIGFHKNLLSYSGKRPGKVGPRMSKAEALRQAMLTLMKGNKFKSPYYWAGFVVVGDGR